MPLIEDRQGVDGNPAGDCQIPGLIDLDAGIVRPVARNVDHLTFRKKTRVPEPVRRVGEHIADRCTPPGHMRALPDAVRGGMSRCTAVDQGPVKQDTLVIPARPLDIAERNPAGLTGQDRVDDGIVLQRLHIAVALKVGLPEIDGAGDIDREQQLQIDKLRRILRQGLGRG